MPPPGKQTVTDDRVRSGADVVANPSADGPKPVSQDSEMLASKRTLASLSGWALAGNLGRRPVRRIDGLVRIGHPRGVGAGEMNPS